MKILILGGYGVFGGRLVRLLSDVAGLEMRVAGRYIAAARRFCAECSGTATLRPLQLDRKDIASALTSERPDLIVDASGPFQAYGDDPYLVVRAAIAAGVDYLDFADGSDFVFGINRFDAEAKAKGVFVLTGASSFPVLTAAVLTEMSKHMRIQKVTGGIAPSPYAGVGLNVMRAVLGYAGGPVQLRRQGVADTGIGLGESLRYTIAVPGRLPLRNLRFSLVDVPDLRVIPRDLPEIEDIWMGAGPVPETLHRMLNFLAIARARLGLPSLAPLASLCHWLLNRLKFGAHRGGMFIEAEGEAEGKPFKRSWHLLAEGDDGPFIPSMAIEGIVRKVLQGNRPTAGARPATGALQLSDYEALFAGRDIYWGWRTQTDASLYQRVLGDDFENLPPQLQVLHQPGKRSQWRGEARITAPTGLIPRLIRRVFGFPQAGQDVPVEVTFTTDAQGRETWARRFGGQLMQSVQEAGHGRDAHLVVEHFGPLRFGLALVRDGARLNILPRQWSILGLPLPRFLMPKGDSFETVKDGRFRFHVEIAVPIFGAVVRYEGWLQPLKAP